MGVFNIPLTLSLLLLSATLPQHGGANAASTPRLPPPAVTAADAERTAAEAATTLLNPPSVKTAVKTTERNCCIGPGLTYDRCSTLRGCAQPRFCLSKDTGNPCEYGLQICHCKPIVMISCSHPSQCPVGETCASLPDQSPYCYSIEIVEIEPSMVVYHGACCLPPTTTTDPPPTTKHPPTTKPPTTEPPTTRPPTTRPPTTRPPTTRPPTTRPPTTRPPTEPPVTGPPTTRSPPTTQPPPPTTDGPPTTTHPVTAVPPIPVPSNSPYPSPPVMTVVPVPSPTGKPPLESASPSPSGGLTGDPCTPTNKCRSYRKCANRGENVPCTACSGVCIFAKVCRCNDECFHGEVCAGAFGKSYCYSPRLIESLDWVVTYPCTQPGLTGDSCTDDANCIGNRPCVKGGVDCAGGKVICGDNRERCSPDHPEGCYCDVKQKGCKCSRDCRDAEICCHTAYGNQCVSRSVVEGSTYLRPVEECPDELKPPTGSVLVVAEPLPPRSDGSFGTPEPDAGPATGGNPTNIADQVCIDARALTHLNARDLVYEKHLVSEVLCDAFGSCATRGHVVLHHGKAMMMESYCKIVSCVSRVLEVNSPKYRRKMTVKSNTEGLLFTVLAARYGTRGEELLLKAAIHAGF